MLHRLGAGTVPLDGPGRLEFREPFAGNCPSPRAHPRDPRGLCVVAGGAIPPSPSASSASRGALVAGPAATGCRCFCARDFRPLLDWETGGCSAAPANGDPVLPPQRRSGRRAVPDPAPAPRPPGAAPPAGVFAPRPPSDTKNSRAARRTLASPLPCCRQSGLAAA